VSAKIQLRRDAAWVGTDTLAAGEVGVDFDASGVVKGIKIGRQDGSSTWTNTDYLQGTVPERSSTGITDLNSANLRGRYVWSSGTGIVTNAPITFVADDGQVTVLNNVFGTTNDTIVQWLSTEGNGTVPSKHYVRVYDTGAAAWRAWSAVTNWAADASNGTAITCTNLDAKGIISAADGTANAPSITNNGDTDTGIFFSADNALSIATAGSTRVTVGAAGGVTMSSNLEVGGDLNMTSGFITNVNDPVFGSQQGAVTVNYLEVGTRVGVTALLIVNGTSISLQVAGKTTSGLFSLSGGTAGLGNLRAAAGQWTGIVTLSTGHYAKIDVNSSDCTATAVGGGASPPTTLSTAFHAVLVRTS
jgi:hypothetical protein